MAQVVTVQDAVDVGCCASGIAERVNKYGRHAVDIRLLKDDPAALKMLLKGDGNGYGNGNGNGDGNGNGNGYGDGDKSGNGKFN